MSPTQGHSSATEARARDARARVPRHLLGRWKPKDRQYDPLDIIAARERALPADLLAKRHKKMAKDPRDFFRGAAALMAADLAMGPLTGIEVQVCGDCHLGNFGLTATPERRIIFDLNDFDETCRASWEFDAKRLATSFALERKGDNVIRRFVRSYVHHLTAFADLPPLAIRYVSIGKAEILGLAGSSARKEVEKWFEDADRSSSLDVVSMADVGDESFRGDGLDPVEIDSQEARDVIAALAATASGIDTAQRSILDRYQPVRVARRSGGIGSLGLRNHAVLLLPHDLRWDRNSDAAPLVLQVKGSRSSALADWVPGQAAAGGHEGRRVVEGARAMQQASDLFLAWTTDGAGRPCYIRQLRDKKASVRDEPSEDCLELLAEVCGLTLARAHSLTGSAATISAYLGEEEPATDALEDFAKLYAEQCEVDHAAFSAAVVSGRQS